MSATRSQRYWIFSLIAGAAPKRHPYALPVGSPLQQIGDATRDVFQSAFNLRGLRAHGIDVIRYDIGTLYRSIVVGLIAVTCTPAPPEFVSHQPAATEIDRHRSRRVAGFHLWSPASDLVSWDARSVSS